VLNRVKQPGWRVTLCCPEPEVTSMDGVTLRVGHEAYAPDFVDGKSSLLRLWNSRQPASRWSSSQLSPG
jgi:hypothetical protein